MGYSSYTRRKQNSTTISTPLVVPIPQEAKEFAHGVTRIREALDFRSETRQLGSLSVIDDYLSKLEPDSLEAIRES